MKVIKQSFSVRFDYPILFTRGVFNPANNILSEALNGATNPTLFLVIDDGVHRHHPNLISEWKDFAQRQSSKLKAIAEPLIVVGGEPSKNDPEVVDSIVKSVNEHGIDRHSFILVIGGGAVLDVVGYAAAIAHRGVRLIRIPSTVLAQNDSGVGVKNGINAFDKKNFLGTFAPPYAVINDSNFLTTLDDRDWRSGIAEAIKVALIKDAEFFETIEGDIQALNDRDQQVMEDLIYRCAHMHVQHIASGDPFEQGSSRPLDFGHWSAHKLEQLTKYQVRHGEAVAIGMALDCTYAHLMGYLSNEHLDRILRLMHQLNFKLFHPELQQQHLLKGLREFREHLGGKLTILLLDAIGSSFEVNEMDQNAILESVDYLRRYGN